MNNKISLKNYRHLKILIIPIFLTVSLCGGMGWYILDLYKAFAKLQTQDLNIINLSNRIVYLDEVLTSSARLAATTGNERWEKRYLEQVPNLDAALAEAQELLPNVFETEGMSKTNEANNKLIAMEDRAFELIGQGNAQAAEALLLSPEYEKQKAIYAEGLAETTAALKNYVETNIALKSQGVRSTIIAIAIALVVLLFSWLIVLRMMNRYILAIEDVGTTIAQTSTEIATTLDQQERNIASQASSVNQTTATVDELGASSRQSAEQAEASSAGANEALSLAEEGAQIVRQTMAGMENLRERVGAIAEQIIHLSQQTKQIASISDLVAELADQTNLLALNAAVEAARAGEHGKGFGVVATEIRKLADESRKSADKINGLVGDIQTAMNSAVMVTDEGSKTTEASIQLAQDTAQTFINVKNAIENVFINSQQISLNVKQQAVGVQEILAAINALNLGAQDSEVGIQQVKASADRLQNSANYLKTLV
ncbi:methyl-accepting chemotaxis protein [Myxosarcina sp. GI1]|uniref:methyl-accepting chemotaxis protein n=1 Tax=Myxosarcina sp. GI1 TaxID=1541065 RepID=UPI0005696205|nr:methyl-accepting chemotaxis protein [Myxosarcina sp. GI1]